MYKNISGAKNIAVISIFAALICILSPLSVPIGPVPVSLSLFAICLSSALLGLRGVVSVIIYISIGLVGLPVFSAFGAGVGTLFGVTGGFIIGYIPCALIVGLVSWKFGGKLLVYMASMAVGVLSCYLCGTLWFMHYTGMGFVAALNACVLPFIVWDIFKVIAAATLAVRLKIVFDKHLQ